MPSSISNFDQAKLTRTIPNKNWFQLLIITAFFLILFIIVWEYYARVRGFEVSIDDNYDLWANTRSKINSDPKQIVMLGSSQVLLDFNLELFTQTLGTKPIQLASVAVNPLI